MYYIPSNKVKGTGVYYEGIAERVPWVMEDGTLDTVTSLHHLKDRKHILDIGCGNGMTLDYFATTADTLAGIDLNDYVNVPSKDKITFSVVDLNFDPLPYADKSMDLVFALQVIEHLENPFYMMREAYRVLQDDGLFVFSVPNPFTFSSKLRFLFYGNARRWHVRNDHLLFLTKDVFEKTYGAHFEVMSRHYQEGVVPFLGRILRLVGIKPTQKMLKILPRSEAFGESYCYVLRKKSVVKSS